MRLLRIKHLKDTYTLKLHFSNHRNAQEIIINTKMRFNVRALGAAPIEQKILYFDRDD